MSYNHHIMKIWSWYLLAGVIVVLGIAAIRSPQHSVTIEPQMKSLSADKTSAPVKKASKQMAEKPKMQIDQNKQYQAVLKTSKGEITVSLNANLTPITVNNFVTLAKAGFYDETVFHRIIKGFMIQGGDPNGNGTGGPGYKFEDEPFKGEYTRGTIAMANSGPNTNGSQFFIMHADYPLPPNYVIFGKVSKGLETVDAIANVAVSSSFSGEKSTPVEPVTLESVSIIEK